MTMTTEEWLADNLDHFGDEILERFATYREAYATMTRERRRATKQGVSMSPEDFRAQFPEVGELAQEYTRLTQLKNYCLRRGLRASEVARRAPSATPEQVRWVDTMMRNGMTMAEMERVDPEAVAMWRERHREAIRARVVTGEGPMQAAVLKIMKGRKTPLGSGEIVALARRHGITTQVDSSLRNVIAGLAKAGLLVDRRRPGDPWPKYLHHES